MDISVVVPCFNEAEGLNPFWQRLSAVMGTVSPRWEAVFVNDGSTDATLEVLEALPMAGASGIRIIDFSRNFGKEAAITAGLDQATGQAVIVIDADLQHPPEVIARMVALWREGVEVVLCRRENRHQDTRLRALTSRLFYSLASRIFEVKIPRDVGDFRLMDRVVVDALSSLRENQRFMKGLFAWIGFRTEVISFEVAERSHGASTFNLWKLINFAIDGITSFTTVPLRLWFYIGTVLSLLSVLYGLVIVIATLAFGTDVPGYPSLAAMIAFLGGIQLIGIGVLGEYIGRTYREVKFRPIYVVRRISHKSDDDA